MQTILREDWQAPDLITSIWFSSAYASSCESELEDWEIITSDHEIITTSTWTHTTTALTLYDTAGETTLCDGHPRRDKRIPASATIYTVILSTSTYVATNTIYSSNTKPSPTCRVNPSDCLNIFKSYSSAESTFDAYFSSFLTVTVSLDSNVDYVVLNGESTSLTRDGSNYPTITVDERGYDPTTYPPLPLTNDEVTYNCGANATSKLITRSAVVNGTTYDADSAYISFDTLYAEGSTRVGRAYNGTIIPVASSDIFSYREVRYPKLACGVEHYLDAAAYSFNFADLNYPVPYSAWAGQPSCQTVDCSTIYNDEYNPFLAVPPEVRALDPAWANCSLSLDGDYDPSTTTPAEPAKTANPGLPSQTSVDPVVTSTAKPADPKASADPSSPSDPSESADPSTTTDPSSPSDPSDPSQSVPSGDPATQTSIDGLAPIISELLSSAAAKASASDSSIPSKAVSNDDPSTGGHTSSVPRPPVVLPTATALKSANPSANPSRTAAAGNSQNPGSGASTVDPGESVGPKATETTAAGTPAAPATLTGAVTIADPSGTTTVPYTQIAPLGGASSDGADPTGAVTIIRVIPLLLILLLPNLLRLGLLAIIQLHLIVLDLILLELALLGPNLETETLLHQALSSSAAQPSHRDLSPRHWLVEQCPLGRILEVELDREPERDLNLGPEPGLALVTVWGQEAALELDLETLVLSSLEALLSLRDLQRRRPWLVVKSSAPILPVSLLARARQLQRYPLQPLAVKQFRPIVQALQQLHSPRVEYRSQHRKSLMQPLSLSLEEAHSL
ncbi:hypothetical protein K490DRAFT_57999 [Saccharata proteae CBS 121410]|uniref:Uncharacterized protein n=1 Tax=Saccharata proteae CBS 121410 TaxID=1314787 RepID=A0A9P4LXS0_9PEZI|nr:hypothetical protein K490DRAFT_57999 [Saccharata proteae CBS 121410]